MIKYKKLTNEQIASSSFLLLAMTGGYFASGLASLGSWIFGSRDWAGGVGTLSLVDFGVASLVASSSAGSFFLNSSKSAVARL